MKIENSKGKKLEIYVPNQKKGFPVVAVGFIAVAVLTFITTLQVQKHDYGNQIIASNRGKVLSSSDVPDECDKAGINLAGGFDLMTQSNYRRAQSHSMKWILAIATKEEEAGIVAEKIKEASNYGLTTIVRICYHDSCHFKNPNDYINFLKAVASQTGGIDFYAIAGPNEPMNENWLPGTEDIPIPLPSNDEEIDRIAKAASDYMNTIIIGMKGTSNVHLLSPAFNMTSHLKEKLHARMIAHGANFAGLEGIAGNLYNVHGTIITQWVDAAKEMYPGQDLYITETGDFDHDIGRLASEINSAIYAEERVKAFLLFNAFGTNPDVNFRYAVMTDAEIAEALGGECSSIIPEGPVPPATGDLVSSCPFDGDFSHDLVSCQINEDFETIEGGGKTTPAIGDCGPGTELCGKLRIAKCGQNATSEECSKGVVPDDGLWHLNYYVTSAVEGRDLNGDGINDEGIPILDYLQSAVADYTQDDRDIQQIPPCFYRNANNFFSGIDFSLKFDGRVGVTSEGDTDYIPFPLLGNAAGCLFYNHNDYYGDFNKISKGFLTASYNLVGEEKENTIANSPDFNKTNSDNYKSANSDNYQNNTSVSQDGEVKGIFDFLSGAILTIQGFLERTFFNKAVSNYETANSFCSSDGTGVKLPGLPVNMLNTADVIAAPKSYEAMIEEVIKKLTDTDLCDMQFNEKKVIGTACYVNGYKFSDSSKIIVGVDPDGNPIEVTYNDEKGKNNGVVDSASGNPVFIKDRERTTEISLDGMKRALAGAYLDEALFFHGMGTRKELSDTKSNSDTTSGFRVIHNANVGIEVPLTVRIYDGLNPKDPLTPVLVENISAPTYCEAGDFYRGFFKLADGKSEGRDYYIIPWIGQIPRMYARIAAVGTDYVIDKTGDLIGTPSGNDPLDKERIPLCSNAGADEDCLVPASDTTADPLFDWLVDEGVLSQAEIAGTFGQAGLTETPVDEPDICVEGGKVLGNYESLMKRVADFINSQSGGSRIPWYVLWGIAYNETWTRCSESHAKWYSDAAHSSILPALGTADGSGPVYDFTDKCSGDPYELAMYKDTNTVDGQGKGVGQFMPGTFTALLTDTYWYRSSSDTDTGALIDACISHLGITDRSTGKNYTTGLVDSALDQGINSVLQEHFSRERVGDSLCAMAVMLSEIAANQRVSRERATTGPYIPENEWTDNDISNAAERYYGGCGHSYCFNAINRARFAQSYFTGLDTNMTGPICPIDRVDGDDAKQRDYIGDLACPVGAGGGTDHRCFQGPFGSYTHCPYLGVHDLPLDLYPLPYSSYIYEDKMRIVAPESGTITSTYSSNYEGGYLGEVVNFRGDSGVEYRFQHLQAGTIPSTETHLMAGERLAYMSFDPDMSYSGEKATFADPQFAQYYDQKRAIYSWGDIHTHITAVYNGKNVDPYLIFGEILGCNVVAPEPGQKQNDPVPASSLVCKKRAGSQHLLNDNHCGTIDSVDTADDNIVRGLFEKMSNENDSDSENPQPEGSCTATRIEPGHYKVELDPDNLVTNSLTRGSHSITEFAQETGAKVAINSNFYGSGNIAIGLYGDQYNPCIGCPVAHAVKAAIAVADNFGSLSMLAQKGKLGLINLEPFYNQTSNFNSVKSTTRGLRNGVSGILLINNGQLANFQTVVAPYSAIGWDSNGRLFAYSSKYTSEALAQKMITDGIQNAILLDGGSSQQLFASGGGIVSSDGEPNSTVNIFTRNIGSYRPVPFYIGSKSCPSN
ncbi:phosphodiester glycosidase family protein [Candidatus Dojkabacteria bacterium]|nr:phosphodiester glycosidase family protein [Candidatus Dojkabacteria bacterium]